MMGRIFGRAKAAAPAGPAAPTISEHVASLEGKSGELEKKIASLEGELVKIKAQINKTPPARQGPLKQKALLLLKRRAEYERMRVRVCALQCRPRERDWRCSARGVPPRYRCFSAAAAAAATTVTAPLPAAAAAAAAVERDAARL